MVWHPNRYHGNRCVLSPTCQLPLLMLGDNPASHPVVFVEVLRAGAVGLTDEQADRAVTFAVQWLSVLYLLNMSEPTHLHRRGYMTSFSTAFTPPLGSSSMDGGLLPRREPHGDSSTAGAEVKNVWTCTSAPPNSSYIGICFSFCHPV
jgi:hypothetical protein